MHSNASSGWTDPYLLERFANHEARPNNLLIKPMAGTLPRPGGGHHHHSTGGGVGSTGRGVGIMMTTTTSGSGLNLQHHPEHPQLQQQAVTTKTGLGPYFHTGTYHPTTTSAGGRDSATTTTNLGVQNGSSGGGGGSGGSDLDINVNVIKNMLLANRVPESCV